MTDGALQNLVDQPQRAGRQFGSQRRQRNLDIALGQIPELDPAEPALQMCGHVRVVLAGGRTLPGEAVRQPVIEARP